MAESEYLTNLAVRYQVLLERLKSERTGVLEKAARDAGLAVTDIIKQLEAGKLSELTRKELRQLLSRMERVQARLYTKALDNFVDELEEVAGYTIEFETKGLEKVFEPSSAAAVSLASASAAYSRALAEPLSATGELLKPFVEGWKQREIAAVNNTIRRAHAEGWTNQEIVQSIRGTRALNYRDGIVATTTRHASAVGRTAVQHVSSAARFETWAANSDLVKGYIWVATLDSKTTQQCRSLDKQKFKIGEGPKPPVHVGCRSTTVADLDERFNFLDRDATRSSAKGPVDAELSYYEWLKKQPAGFQDVAIGPTRAKLLREGGLSAEKFAKLNLGKRFEPLTLDEMRQLEPAAFERAGL